VLPLALIGLLMAGCGAAAATSTSAPGLGSGTSAKSAVQNSGPSSMSSGSAVATASLGGTNSASPYLVKSLNVVLSVTNPLNASQSIQNWISSSDTHAVSAGTMIQRGSDGTYTVSMTVSVSSAAYGAVKTFLTNYAVKFGGN